MGGVVSACPERRVDISKSKEGRCHLVRGAI
jgi:hypothetical protein